MLIDCTVMFILNAGTVTKNLTLADYLITNVIDTDSSPLVLIRREGDL